jgi:hypothetical protein
MMDVLGWVGQGIGVSGLGSDLEGFASKSTGFDIIERDFFPLHR